jgi:hypothetical protein
MHLLVTPKSDLSRCNHMKADEGRRGGRSFISQPQGSDADSKQKNFVTACDDGQKDVTDF